MLESLVGLLAGGGGGHSFGDAAWLILIIWAAAIPLLIAAARHVAGARTGMASSAMGRRIGAKTRPLLLLG